MENRPKLFCEYFGVPMDMFRPFVMYDRYYEAGLIVEQFKKQKIDFKKLRILDYGCGMGDYGMTFLRHGACVRFFDYERYTHFVKVRCTKENLKTYELHTIENQTHNPIDPSFDLVIFGDVLEHVDDPLNLIGQCINLGIKYVFTTAYPYVTDPNYFNKAGHKHGGWDNQPQARKLLEDHFSYIKFNGQLRLWRKK